MPPFEELPVFIQVVLTLSSALILLIGGHLIWRIVRAVLRRDNSR
jgi:hypothetical protein